MCNHRDADESERKKEVSPASSPQRVLGCCSGTLSFFGFVGITMLHFCSRIILRSHSLSPVETWEEDGRAIAPDQSPLAFWAASELAAHTTCEGRGCGPFSKW